MIDSRADIHETAKIADNVSIGPWTVIGPNVEIDEGTVIASHVVIDGPTRIGKNNRIFSFSSIGGISQDKKDDGGNTLLEIGDNNTIRECVTINRGTEQGGGVTRIGNNNWLMAYVHIAHDCIVGNNVVFANNATLAGHVTVKDFAGLGGFSAVHQFCVVGEYSFAAGKSAITKDVLPYLMVSGDRAKAVGLNTVGLERNGFTKNDMTWLRRAYKTTFRSRNTTQEALIALHEVRHESKALPLLMTRMENSERGFVR